MDGGGDAFDEDGGVVARGPTHIFRGHEGDGQSQLGIIEADNLFLEVDDLPATRACIPLFADLEKGGDDVRQVGVWFGCFIGIDQGQCDLMTEELFGRKVKGEEVKGKHCEAVGVEEGVGGEEVRDLRETAFAKPLANVLYGEPGMLHALVVELPVDEPLEAEDT